VIALVGTACSGGEEAAPTTIPTTTPATVATTVPVTVAVPPVTTQPPPATSAAPTSAPATSEPPMSTAVSSTTPPGLSPLNATLLPTLETELPLVIVEFTNALEEGLRVPADQGRREVLRALTGPDLYGRIEATLDRWVAEGRSQRERPGDPPRVEAQLSTSGMSAGEPIAFMDACFIGTDIMIQMGPDGTETVTDSDIDSSLYSYVFEFVDGRWLIVNFSLVESFLKTEGCEQ
jgi:hypothetical protein